MPPMLVGTIEGGKAVGGVVTGGKRRPRFSIVTVFEAVFVTMAAPVSSSTATPVGLVPVVTSAQGTVPVEPLGAAHCGGAGGFWVKSMTEAVPAPLLATTANPFFCQTAMPCGLVPTEIGLPMI